MNDIKETVRNSGDKLCRVLTSLTVRLSDVTLTDVSDASQTMDLVLPLLLTEGILSKVDSIRKASIVVVMKLAKVSIVLLLYRKITIHLLALLYDQLRNIWTAHKVVFSNNGIAFFLSLVLFSLTLV